MSVSDSPMLFHDNDVPSPRPNRTVTPTAATAFTEPATEVLPADLAHLLNADVSTAKGGSLVDLIVAAERLAGWVHARSQELMAALAVPGVPGPTCDLAKRILHPDVDTELDDDADVAEALEWEAAQRLASDELAAVLVQSPVTMRNRINRAQILVLDFPTTHAALASGRLCRSKAAVVVERLQFVADPDIRARLEESAAKAAGGRAPGRLGSLIDQWVMAADPEAAERRRQAARTGRKVTHRPLPDGMGRLSADLTADASTTIYSFLSDVGRATQGCAGEEDHRTLDQCRADLLSDVLLSLAAGATISLRTLLGGPEAAHPAQDNISDLDDADPVDLDQSTGHGTAVARTHHGRPLHAVISLTLEALAALTRDPASLVGYGAITADWAKTLADAARTVTLIVTDQNGHAVGASACTYRPKQMVRDQVITMNPTCIFTHCTKDAHYCDLDHDITFCHDDPTSGGPTTAGNLQPLCRKHHQLKTHGGWTIKRLPDGNRAFTSPLGTRTVSPPADLPSAAPPF